MKNKKLYRAYVIAGIATAFILLSSSGFYTYWSIASPDKTCVSCHEINPSFNTWASSPHREISCFECHGSALENGLHSLKEKSKMVFTHISDDVKSEDLKMNEEQILATMTRCTNCHQTEYYAWKSGGHSAMYADIFLHEGHNRTEQLNGDCLRCHGMFYEKTTSDLVEPISTMGPWKLKDTLKTNQPVIPCLACHQIHIEGNVTQKPDYKNPNGIFYNRNSVNNSIGLYSRSEKMHFSLKQLPRPAMYLFGDTIMTPDSDVYKLCVQCHAPSFTHEVGTGDDRTPIGVHAGLSCDACHSPHSNDQKNACDKCHPAISNCKLDVKTMNTTYHLPSSKNDIHFVSCKNCHPDMMLN